MELLLNLVWLLMAVPAYWVWRQQRREFDSLRCLLTLACVIVLLFPVISASDDLHAMRPEMEESSPNKRALQQPGSRGATQADSGMSPASTTTAFAITPGTDVLGWVAIEPVPDSHSAVQVVRSGRAPPASLSA